MTASRTRTTAALLLRSVKSGNAPTSLMLKQFSGIEGYNIARKAMVCAIKLEGDDRPLAKQGKAWMGNGNRSKRRAGWKLTKWYCDHLSTGGDCCCEPQSGYYYEQP